MSERGKSLPIQSVFIHSFLSEPIFCHVMCVYIVLKCVQ